LRQWLGDRIADDISGYCLRRVLWLHKGEPSLIKTALAGFLSRKPRWALQRWKKVPHLPRLSPLFAGCDYSQNAKALAGANQRLPGGGFRRRARAENIFRARRDDPHEAACSFHAPGMVARILKVFAPGAISLPPRDHLKIATWLPATFE
jgi:hypothetical protein